MVGVSKPLPSDSVGQTDPIFLLVRVTPASLPGPLPPVFPVPSNCAALDSITRIAIGVKVGPSFGKPRNFLALTNCFLLPHHDVLGLLPRVFSSLLCRLQDSPRALSFKMDL